MATTVKSKVLKSNKTKAKSSLSAAKSHASTSAAKKKMAKPVAAKAIPVAHQVMKPAEATASDKKTVSQKLIETIEKRKNNPQPARPGIFSRPPGRRGRRPKGAVEYTPEHREEEGYVLESDNQAIEYDTGIRLKQGRED